MTLWKTAPSPQARIDESVLRILAVKYSFGILA